MYLKKFENCYSWSAGYHIEILLCPQYSVEITLLLNPTQDSGFSGIFYVTHQLRPKNALSTLKLKTPILMHRNSTSQPGIL